MEAGAVVGAVVAVGPAVGPVQFGESATLHDALNKSKISGVTVSAFMSEILYDSHPGICKAAEPAGALHRSMASL